MHQQINLSSRFLYVELLMNFPCVEPILKKPKRTTHKTQVLVM